MEKQTITKPINEMRMATMGRVVFSKSAYYLKNGQALYWATFLLLIFIELLLGGQLSRILTSNNYSLYVNVLNTLPFYNVVANIGLSYGMIYIIAYNPGIKFRIFRQTLQLQTVWYLILIAAHLAVFFFFNNNAWIESLLITIVITYTYSYRLNINAFFLATRSYNKAALANTLQKVALIALVMVICYSNVLKQLLNDRFLITYPFIELGVVLLYFIVFWQTNLSAFEAPKINYQKRIWKYSKYAMFNNGINLLNYTIIAFIIRASHIGVHIQITLLLCVVFFRYTGVAIAPVFAIITPSFTTIKNDTARVKQMYKKYYLLIFAISLLTLLLCRFCFGFIIAHFYAAVYRDLPYYFNFFSYLIPFSFLNSLNATIMAALGKIKYTFKVEVVCIMILALFLVYNLMLPVADYSFFYYMMLIYLTIKFLLQSYGAYSLVHK